MATVGVKELNWTAAALIFGGITMTSRLLLLLLAMKRSSLMTFTVPRH